MTIEDFKIDWLIGQLGNNMSEETRETFRLLVEPLSEHFYLGMAIRNRWGLWESDESKKSELVKFFNSHGIYHADDMSGIILTSYHCMLNNKSIEFEAQVQSYKDFWKKQGFKDGIFTEKENKGYEDNL